MNTAGMILAGALIAIPCGFIGAVLSMRGSGEREAMVAPGLTVPGRDRDGGAGKAGFITAIAETMVSLTWLIVSAKGMLSIPIPGQGL